MGREAGLWMVLGEANAGLALGEANSGFSPVYRKSGRESSCQNQAVGNESLFPPEALPFGSLSQRAVALRQSLRLIHEREAELKARIDNAQGDCKAIPSHSAAASYALPQLVRNPADASTKVRRGRIGESRSCAFLRLQQH